MILRRPASRTTVSTRDLVSVLTIPELYHGVASKSEWSLEFTSDPWTVRGLNPPPSACHADVQPSTPTAQNVQQTSPESNLLCLATVTTFPRSRHRAATR